MAYSTRYAELSYHRQSPGLWRFTDPDGVCVGPLYQSRADLLDDLDRFASIYGCKGAPNQTLDVFEVEARVQHKGEFYRVKLEATTAGTFEIDEYTREEDGVSTLPTGLPEKILKAFKAVLTTPI